MRKKIFSILLSVAMVMVMMPSMAFAETSASSSDITWYGDGSANDYIISNKAELAGLAQLVNDGNTFYKKTIKLGADIDLEGNDENPWIPIGANGKSFAGSFDGDNHTISNLYIHDTSTSGSGFGLFGSAGNSSIMNLTINNAHVMGNSAVAVVAGKSNGTIKNVKVTGKIEVGTTTNQGTQANFNSSYIGGIVGWGYPKVSDCQVIGDGTEISIIGGRQVGGIIGFCGEGKAVRAQDCVVKNITIKGSKSVGGILGWAHYGNGITNCSVDNIIVELNASSELNTVGVLVGSTYGNTGYSNRYAGNTVTNSILYVNGEEKTIDRVELLYSNYGSDYCIDEGNNTYVYYTGTLQDAITNATDGQNIVLIGDLSGNATVPEDKAVIIEMNGYSISGDFGVPAITNNGILTLKNGTVIGDLSGENITLSNVTKKEPTCVAMIGDAKYGSLTNAIAAARNDDVIKMMKDTVETIEIADGKTLTIDLNGCKLSGVYNYTIDNYGVLTIQDSLGGGEVSGTKYAVYNNGSDDTLNVSSGKIIAKNYGVYNKGTVNVSGTATLQSTESAENTDGVAVFNTGGGTAYISGGMILCVNDGSLHHMPVYGGTSTITGGTFSSDVSQYIPDNYVEYSMRNGTYIVKAADAEKPAFTTGNYWSDLDGKVYTEMYSAPSTPSDNVTNSGTTGSDNAQTNADMSDKVTVSEGTASTVVDQTTADKIVDKAVANESKEVVIDATTSSSTTSNTVSSAQVGIPTATLEAIAEKTDADVTVKTDVAEVKMDNITAAAVAEQATGDTVQIIAEKVKEDQQEIQFELKVVCSNGTVISDFKGGNVSVTVPVTKNMADKKLVCVYIDDNGIYHKVDGSINEEGTHYTFTTGHFSTYAIMSEEEADAIISKQTAEEQLAKLKKVKTTVTLSTKEVKKGIRVTVKVPEDQKADKTGIIIYRSTSKNAKPYAVYKKVATKGSTYIIRNYYNVKGNRLVKGKTYYYKARAYKVIDGKTYYGPMSTIKSIKAK